MIAPSGTGGSPAIAASLASQKAGVQYDGFLKRSSILVLFSPKAAEGWQALQPPRGIPMRVFSSIFFHLISFHIFSLFASFECCFDSNVVLQTIINP